MNYARTALLLAALTGIFLAIGYFIGGTQGMVIAFGIAIATNLFTYWNADKMVLRMYGAREVDARTAPQFYSIVEQLAVKAGLPMPKVYVIDNPQPNAFATGRNPQHAAVAATTGLLNAMDAEEIAAVMAHELGHVKNHDTLTMTIAAMISGAIGMLAHFAFMTGGMGGRDSDGRSNPIGAVVGLLVLILAPVAAMLVQMAISRTREYSADRMGAEITGQPLWLASALGKLEQAAHRIPNAQAEQNPATAHLFIVNPLNGQGMDNLFSTHPNTANRIAALQAMAGQPGPRGGQGSSQGSRPAASPSRNQGTRNQGPWSQGSRDQGSHTEGTDSSSSRPRRGPWG